MLDVLGALSVIIVVKFCVAQRRHEEVKTNQNGRGQHVIINTRVDWDRRREYRWSRILARDRRDTHALIDVLPAEKLTAVKILLEVMVEPLARSLALAEAEDELAPETIAALDRARTSLARGKTAPMTFCANSACSSERRRARPHGGYVVSGSPLRPASDRPRDGTSNSPLH